MPDWAKVMLERHTASMIYLRNVQHFSKEDDFFAPRVMTAAARWLERSRDQAQFYLHIDSFDVHEPFHIPEPYRSLYTDDDPRKYSPWPLYGRVDEGNAALSDEELAWVRAQFAGKLTMVDTWLGRVFETLRETGLMERCCVILTTDHGHFLGEHGWVGKPAAPLYDTLCRPPLFVWYPDGAHNGERIAAITQTVDLHATVLELLGLPPRASHSRSLVPLLLDKTAHHRDFAAYGYCGERVGVTDGDWTLLREHAPAPDAYWYSSHSDELYRRSFAMRFERPAPPELEAGRFIPGVSRPVWRMKAATRVKSHGDLLFHSSDPPKNATWRASVPTSSSA